MVYAQYQIHTRKIALIMKKFYTLCVLIVLCNIAIAQPGRNIKQPPKIKGVPTAISNTKVKIHANSNSVYGTAKTHPNYSKKPTPKKEASNSPVVAKADQDKKSKGKKSGK